MRNQSRRILHYECGLCDYWRGDVLGVYTAGGEEVAGFAVESVEVEWGRADEMR